MATGTGGTGKKLARSDKEQLGVARQLKDEEERLKIINNKREKTIMEDGSRQYRDSKPLKYVQEWVGW